MVLIYFFNILFKNCPVKLSGTCAISSGVPVAITVPPLKASHLFFMFLCRKFYFFKKNIFKFVLVFP